MPNSNKLTVAVIQAAPVLFDRDASTDKACQLIADAAKNKPHIILLPEAFIPAYPRGLSFGTTIGKRTSPGRDLWHRYWSNSVDIPSPTTDKLAKAAKAAKAYLAIGIIERDTQFNSGSLYCTLLYFSPTGEIIGKHRKIKPTAAERLIWGEGDGSTLTVIQTPLAKTGGLICWENYMPLARMAIYSKGVQIYLAPTADDRDSWQPTLQHIACEGRCFVLGCNQYVTKADYPADLEMYEELNDMTDPICRGGSTIISPFGKTIVGPVYNKQQTLFAELDLDEIIKAKYDFDPLGHYACPNIFHLSVNESPQPPVSHINNISENE